MFRLSQIVISLSAVWSFGVALAATDPYLWLETVDSADANNWVRSENARTQSELDSDPRFAKYYADALAVEQAPTRIPFAQPIYGKLWNFWQDADHPHGVWRTTSPKSYDNSASPDWRTVLDLDQLASTEGTNWAWKGVQCNAMQENRCMIALSDGGEDAVIMREFDLSSGQFVSGGFTLTRSRQYAAWDGKDSLLVAREWIPGELTKSGYPFVVKRLRRGLSPSEAVEIFRGQPTDARLKLKSLFDGKGHRITLIQRGITFFDWETRIVTPTGSVRLNLPAKSSVVALSAGQLIVRLDESWPEAGSQFAAGAVVSVDQAQALANPDHLHPRLVFAPGARQSTADVQSIGGGLVITYLDNVRTRISLCRYANGTWQGKSVPIPENSSVRFDDKTTYAKSSYAGISGYLQPESQWRIDGTGARRIRQLPAQFDTSQLVVEQYLTPSSDGVRIPYTIVRAKGMAMDGNHPTIVHAYGGFGISETPEYSGVIGKLWLEHGGIYVVANIRGGGEFGPAWHEAGLKTKRQIVYDDFTAVARDLIARGITKPRRMGIMGGSNGGLLMGVQMTQHPELWNAVDIAVPLLDMLRFEKIAAGSLWTGEYGSVQNPAERDFLAQISPYENLRRGVRYPKALIWTTAKDDRVGPQHARKFAARLAEFGIPRYFYESSEGGHSADSNLDEIARIDAMEFIYFTRQLIDE